MTDEELNKIEEKDEAEDRFVFMREEIKSRPINRKHLARNTLLAAISALVFGLVACVTFALLAPFVTEKIAESSEEEEPLPVIIFPEETKEEEMNPEDMLTEEDEVEVDEELFAFLEEQEIKKIISSVKFTLSDYQEIYNAMSAVAQSAMHSVVRVTPVKSDKDMFDNMYETASELSGIIVAESEEEVFILTRYSSVKGNNDIVVSFSNDIQARAELINWDSSTDICILSVKGEDINEVTKENIAIASFASSNSPTLVGSPVIAIGSPMGTYESVNYGMVTSSTAALPVTDNSYRQIVTNIYGSPSASGVIINLRGDIVAYTDVKFSSNDTKNLICGIGISELRATIERLVNRKDIVAFGIKGRDVPNEAVMVGAPKGVYVLSVDLDSSAMEAGIQSGDIITAIGDAPITRFSEFLSEIKKKEIGTTETVTLFRSAQGEYREVTTSIDYEKINK